MVYQNVVLTKVFTHTESESLASFLSEVMIFLLSFFKTPSLGVKLDSKIS